MSNEGCPGPSNQLGDYVYFVEHAQLLFATPDKKYQGWITEYALQSSRIDNWQVIQIGTLRGCELGLFKEGLADFGFIRGYNVEFIKPYTHSLHIPLQLYLFLGGGLDRIFLLLTMLDVGKNPKFRRRSSQKGRFLTGVKHIIVVTAIILIHINKSE